MFVYQLVAKGVMQNFNRIEEVRSSTVFLTEDAANKLIPKMREVVTKSGIGCLLDDNNLKIKVIPLEVVE